MKTEQFFKVGKNKIGYVGDNFQNNFYGTTFNIPKKLKLQTKTLERLMLDKEILENWKPKEFTLGELAWALKNPKEANLLENGYANIFYIRDKSNTLWAVCAYWGSVDGGWSLGANSVSDPRGWHSGYQVVSQAFGFGKLDSSDIGNLETSGIYSLNERVRSLEEFKAKVEKLINL